MTDQETNTRLSRLEQAVIDLATVQGPYVETIRIVGEPSDEAVKAAHDRLQRATREITAMRQQRS